MCDNCAEARKLANQVAEEISRADKSREFYRRQGECRERERIVGRIKAQICFDALVDQDGRCLNHNGKCYELGLLIQELTAGQIAAVKECEHSDLKHTDSSAHLAFCPDCELEFSCECEAKEIK